MPTAIAIPALADPALASAKKCMECHNVAVKVVGPCVKYVSTKYQTDTSAMNTWATWVLGLKSFRPQESKKPADQRAFLRETVLSALESRQTV